MSEPTTAPADEWLVRFGDVAVSRHWVSTPAGVAPLRGVTFTLVDRTVPVTKIPTWVVVVAVVGFFVVFILSLLFLLVKETAPKGMIDVVVTRGDSTSTTTTLVITSLGDRADLYARVASAQQLAAAA